MAYRSMTPKNKEYDNTKLVNQFQLPHMVPTEVSDKSYSPKPSDIAVNYLDGLEPKPPGMPRLQRPRPLLDRITALRGNYGRAGQPQQNRFRMATPSPTPNTPMSQPDYQRPLTQQDYLSQLDYQRPLTQQDYLTGQHMDKLQPAAQKAITQYLENLKKSQQLPQGSEEQRRAEHLAKRFEKTTISIGVLFKIGT